MNRQQKPMPKKQSVSTAQQLAQARELLAWYGPGTVQHAHAMRELERLAQERDGEEAGK